MGYPVVAFSWRGTSGTFPGEGVKKVKLAEHVQDLQGFLEKLPSILGDEKDYPKPILLSHLLGGIIVMKFLDSCCSPSHCQGLFDALDNNRTTATTESNSNYSKQSEGLKRRSQSLGWRNRYSQDAYYPLDVNGIKYLVQQVQQGEVEGAYGSGPPPWC
jgi:hypothetical protein